MGQFSRFAFGNNRVQAGNKWNVVPVHHDDMPARSFVILGSINEHDIAIFEHGLGGHLLQMDVEFRDVLIVGAHVNESFCCSVDVPVVQIAVPFVG